MIRANIEAERGRLQMTKTQMCSELGITAKTYNSYIHGAPIPSSILVKLSDMSGQTIDYLLDRCDRRVQTQAAAAQPGA